MLVSSVTCFDTMLKSHATPHVGCKDLVQSTRMNEHKENYFEQRSSRYNPSVILNYAKLLSTPRRLIFRGPFLYGRMLSFTPSRKGRASASRSSRDRNAFHRGTFHCSIQTSCWMMPDPSPCRQVAHRGSASCALVVAWCKRDGPRFALQRLSLNSVSL